MSGFERGTFMKSRIVISILVMALLAVVVAGAGSGLLTCGACQVPIVCTAQRVGFDIDGTLLHSDPAFDETKRTSTNKPYSEEWWGEVNMQSNKTFCKPKRMITRILREYQKKNVEIYAITARHRPHGQYLKEYVCKTFDIPVERIFFEPDSKTAKIKELKLDVFYGDSDTDIQYAQEAGILAIRVLRHPSSTYWKHYDPGMYGEEILRGSEF